MGDRGVNFYHLYNSVLFILGSKYTEKNSSEATLFPTHSEKSKDPNEICTTRNMDLLGQGSQDDFVQKDKTVAISNTVTENVEKQIIS